MSNSLKYMTVNLGKVRGGSELRMPLPALERIVERLAETERAYAILRGKGYGKPWMDLDEIASLVPANEKSVP